MLHRVAEILTAQIEPITRAWVADLRQTPATEIHNNLFTRQIVDGLKASLAALAETLDRREGLAIITEGLLGYLEHDAVKGIWRRFARTLGGFRSGVYISDIHIGELQNAQRELLCPLLHFRFVHRS